jgi:4'-phosphopantetheinyl transferase EntD
VRNRSEAGAEPHGSELEDRTHRTRTVGVVDAEERELELGLRLLAIPQVRVGCRRISDLDIGALHEVEAAHVERAVARRRREFATGRELLRSLLGDDLPIPVADDRSPILPDGVRASLAHDDQFAVAVLSRDPSIVALGIDLEPASPLEADEAALILRRDESSLDAHLAFTMKEAAYKAWSTLGGRMLDHRDVRLSVSGGAFEATVDGVTTLRGAWRGATARWIALVVVVEPQG